MLFKNIDPPEVNDPRYTSRKWILVNRIIRLYTYVHLLNMALLMSARYNKFLDGELLKSLWFTSLSTWSLGVVTAAGWYVKQNIDQKKINRKKILDGGVK